MKNKLKFILFIVLSIINLSWGQENNFPKQVGFVNDFEKILSTEEVAKLENLLLNYEKQTSNEIVIVTLDQNINEENFITYALDLANEWEVGKQGKDNGLVIVISKKLRLIRMCTGIGTGKILTDEICEKIIDQDIIPNFKKGEIYNGFSNGINTIIEKWK